MQRKKELVDASVERAAEDRGVVVVHTGNGKGKSSAAFGMAVRALGHGLRVSIVQFIKGESDTGEAAFFHRFPEVDFYALGAGFTWETQDATRDVAASRVAWEQAKRLLTETNRDLVVLDELNIALKLGHLPVGEVVDALGVRPKHQHVIITGRGAPAALMEAADTVTEMQMIKHAFQAGVRAQKGIEW
jgi:cob(I)alamin adenosyltransferase